MLSDKIIERARIGVVRKISVSFSPIKTTTRDNLAKLLQTEPCSLLELDVSYSKISGGHGGEPKPMFDGMGLPQLLLGTLHKGPHLRRFASRNLKVLGISGCGLVGPIPPEIGHCKLLELFNASDQQLTGGLPREITRCRSLMFMSLENNKLKVSPGSVSGGHSQVGRMNVPRQGRTHQAKPPAHHSLPARTIKTMVIVGALRCWGARAGRERQGLLAAELLLQLPKLVFVSFDGNVELVVGARPKEAVDAHIEANHGKDIRPVSQSAWKAMLLGNYGGLLEASGCERWPGVVEG